MKYQHGWAFPDADVFMLHEISPSGEYQRSHLESALAYVNDWTCSVDGGGHVGTFARLMAARFARVVSVEPSADTYEALCANMIKFGCTNVETRRAALGAHPGMAQMTLDARNADRSNTGARHVVDGEDVPVVTVDSLALETLGLLKLDVEGSEPMALMGAADTLRRCRPVVLVEDKGLWMTHYDLPKTAVRDILTAQSYRLAETVGCDQVWVPR